MPIAKRASLATLRYPFAHADAFFGLHLFKAWVGSSNLSSGGMAGNGAGSAIGARLPAACFPVGGELPDPWQTGRGCSRIKRRAEPAYWVVTCGSSDRKMLG